MYQWTEGKRVNWTTKPLDQCQCAVVQCCHSFYQKPLCSLFTASLLEISTHGCTTPSGNVLGKTDFWFHGLRPDSLLHPRTAPPPPPRPCLPILSYHLNRMPRCCSYTCVGIDIYTLGSEFAISVMFTTKSPMALAVHGHAQRTVSLRSRCGRAGISTS